jgi:hypothetical protein
LEDLFKELVSIPQLLSNPNFSLEILMIREEESRRYVGKREWRRRGWAIEGRRSLAVLDQSVFGVSADWLRFIPDGLESFTASELATATATGHGRRSGPENGVLPARGERDRADRQARARQSVPSGTRLFSRRSGLLDRALALTAYNQPA